jgi:hypothetical protein
MQSFYYLEHYTIPKIHASKLAAARWRWERSSENDSMYRNHDEAVLLPLSGTSHVEHCDQSRATHSETPTLSNPVVALVGVRPN